MDKGQRIGRVRPGWHHWATAVAVVTICAVAGTLASGPMASAGDADLAQFLLKGGKKAISKRAYDDGISRLEKALVEDPALFEAHYWIALGHDKLKNVPAAVSAYRTYRDIAEAKGDLERSLASLLRKTTSRLRVLAAGETELNKMNNRFANDAAKLAEKCFLRDPGLAQRIAEAAAALVPNHKGANKILAKLGAGKARGEGPTQDVFEWDDFLARSLFGSNTGWKYDNKTKILEIVAEKNGTFITPRAAFQSPKDYVFEIEGKFIKFFGDAGLGICFAKIGSKWITCHFSQGEIVLWKSDGATQQQEDLVRHPIDPRKMDTWYRLSVAVKGDLVQVFLNGKKKFEKKVSGVDDLAGDVGLFYQRSHTQIRSIRLGERK